VFISNEIQDKVNYDSSAVKRWTSCKVKGKKKGKDISVTRREGP
jgi:hypothetical protein